MPTELEELTTDRLIAHRMQVSDFPDLCRMHGDPVVMATLVKVRSDEWTQQFLEREIEHWERYGFGLWVFRDRLTHQFVGRAGLRHTHVNQEDGVELAYALMSSFWGQGLATEIAQTSVKVGFRQLYLPQILCFTLTTNYASQRVMEKVGFQYESRITHANLPHVFYRLTKPQWDRMHPHP